MFHRNPLPEFPALFNQFHIADRFSVLSAFFFNWLTTELTDTVPPINRVY